MRLTVVGAGNAGLTAAADLALGGADVTLYELPDFAANIQPVRDAGAIELENNRLDGTGRAGSATLSRVTTDAAEAVAGADVIIVAAQAIGQQRIAEDFAPHLRAGQVLVLLTGYGGSLLVRKVFRDRGVSDEVLVAETATLPYMCRRIGSVRAEMHGRELRALPTAAMPASDTARVVAVLRRVYPFIVPAANVLETALLNSNPLRHPVGTILNIGRIEYSGGEFWIYREGFTPSVWRVLEALDAEKVALLAALGLEPRSYLAYRDWVFDLTLDEQAETGPKGPPSAETRYLAEDVPLGLVFFASLGRALSVPTPTADSLIQLACAINGVDYRASGRTLEHLGLSQVTADSLLRYVETGDE